MTDPVDANVFLRDGLIFQQSDYLAVISLYDMTQPDHAMPLDRGHRQFDLIPLPVGD